MNGMSKTEYLQAVAEQSKRSPLIKDCAAAFTVGGLICVIGQLLLEFYQSTELDLLSAKAMVSVSLIFLSAFFTALGIFDRLAKFAGAGTLVPITGFANSVVSPAIEYKADE